ncbi:MAG TPA: DUF4132 domain-containing protein [Allosphingosinicella sp.]|nr:DUF4132 domain-containing protein [Allosphingosinicella sp.]
MFGRLVRALTGGKAPAPGPVGTTAARRDEARSRIRADAGELLWAAIEAALDENPLISSYSLRDAEKHRALRTLIDQSVEDRGRSFHVLLRILTDFGRYGVGNWGLLVRRDGYYRVDALVRQPQVRGMENILEALAVRKLVLADADGDAARLVAILPEYGTLYHRRILTFLLDTARAHPGGRTVAALRGLIRAGLGHYRSKWAAEIEDLLRDLPASPRASVPVTAGGAAPKEAGVAPIALPRFLLNTYEGQTAFAGHFEAMFEARLYDEAHLGFLARLAGFADRIDTLPPSDPRARVVAIEALARECGLALVDNSHGRSWGYGLEGVANLGRDRHQRFTALAPYVAAWPEPLRRLGRHAGAIASKTAPSAKWLAEGRAMLAEIPADQRLAMLRAMTDTTAPLGWPGQSGGEHVLRAFLYLSSDLDPSAVGPLLADYALKRCYVTVPNQGIRAEKLGNACLWVLAAMPAGTGVPYLARILARTRYPKIRARIDEKLNQAAAAAGLSRSALDELTVPGHDLDPEGELHVPVGGGKAVIKVEGARDVSVSWLSDSGKPLKSPSAAMKADKDRMRSVRDSAKEIEADLGTLVVRLQRLYLEDRRWPAGLWLERYLDQPLVRTLARRLIWWVEPEDGGAVSALPGEAGGAMLDVAGKPVPLDGATIRLWHPIEAQVGEVEAWRDRLEALEITQPFAQAWREVYTLTDAERATATYTNRWAAHILKQHQAMMLARLNGWRVTHRMWVDAPNDDPWHLNIPAHGLVADYWVEGAGGDSPEVTDSCAYVHVATDRIQFHPVIGGADSARGPARGPAVALTEVPPLIFSEIMRHADLFTSVASIAADPNWLDRGGDAHHPDQWAAVAANYWNSTNTAELEESGKRRRAMLERILPRLKIAGRLSLDDRYLMVQGRRHLYRIHLGSGACFRGERHICIVPKPAAEEGRIWLPFEGDRTLSIIISKALLLADDDKITDPVILRQL